MWEQLIRQQISRHKPEFKKIRREARKKANMIREFHFTDTPTRKLHVTADPHLGHKQEFIWGTRGFKSSKEHDDYWINSVNETVRADDTLLIIGDMCLNTTLEQFEDYIARIHCQNILMLWGNHNNPLARIYKAEVAKAFNRPAGEIEVYPFRYKNVIFLGNRIEGTWNSQLFVADHFPISIWNYVKNGAWMLCGHSHHGFKGSLPATVDTGKILDVGFDGYKKTLSFSEVQEIMSKKEIIKNDEHH